MVERQEILHLWLVAAALDTEVIAWARYGTSDDPQDPATRPYRTGVAALDAGWLLLQAPGPLGPDDGDGALGCEFVFGRARTLD